MSSPNPLTRRYQEKARKWARTRLLDDGWWPDRRDDPWWDGYNPRDEPTNPAFEKLLEECEPRIDSYWDEREPE